MYAYNFNFYSWSVIYERKKYEVLSDEVKWYMYGMW